MIHKKYLRVFTNSWQASLEYRVDTFMHFAIASISLLSVFYLWNNIYAGRAELMGYTKQDIITYYIIIGYLLSAIYAYVPVAVEIREGELSKYLIKPIGYFSYHYWQSLARRVFRLLLGLPVLILIFTLFQNHITFITNPVSYALLLLMALGAINILFFLDVIISLFEFWILYAESIGFIIELIIMFLAGSYIPLVFLPGWIQGIANVTPFKYTGVFIVDGFMGRLSPQEIFIGIGIQLFWTFILYLLTKFIFTLGLKRYEAFGG